MYCLFVASVRQPMCSPVVFQISLLLFLPFYFMIIARTSSFLSHFFKQKPAYETGFIRPILISIFFVSENARWEVEAISSLEAKTDKILLWGISIEREKMRR